MLADKGEKPRESAEVHEGGSKEVLGVVFQI
jgi:hypothetical protein